MSINTSIFSPYGRIGDPIPYYSNLAKEADQNGSATIKGKIRGTEVDIIAKIVMMSPEQYIEESRQFYLFFDHSEKDVEEELEDRYYKVSSDKGLAFFDEHRGNIFLPYLDYTNGDQDGLHRATYASIKSDIKEIPVLMIFTLPAYQNLIGTDYLDELEDRGIIMENTRLNEDTTLRDYYMSEFPEDDMGQEIHPDATFMGLFEALDNYEDVYEYIFGDPMGGDSLVRERIFAGLAEVMKVDYEYIYDQWLMATSMHNESKRAELLENEANETYEYFLKAGSQALSEIPSDQTAMVKEKIKNSLMAKVYDTDELEPALDIVNRTQNSEQVNYKDSMIKRLELIVVSNILQHIDLLVKTQDMDVPESIEMIESNEKHVFSIAEISTDHFLDMVNKLYDSGWTASLMNESLKAEKALEELHGEIIAIAETTIEDAGMTEGYMEAVGLEDRIEDHRRADTDTVEMMLETFFDNSALTFEGLAVDSIPDALEFFIEEKGQENAFANIFSGAQFNEVFRLSGRNAYPEDFAIVVFENTGTVLAISIGARWLNDIVNNNAEREGYHPFDPSFGGDWYNESRGMTEGAEEEKLISLTEKDDDDPCWDGYEQYGMKMKDGQEVPNCIPIEESVEESVDIEPEFMEKLHELFGDLADLRNRISPDGDETIYEEDHLLLDEVLDAMEVLMGHEMMEEVYGGVKKKH